MNDGVKESECIDQKVIFPHSQLLNYTSLQCTAFLHLNFKHVPRKEEVKECSEEGESFEFEVVREDK